MLTEDSRRNVRFLFFAFAILLYSAGCRQKKRTPVLVLEGPPEKVQVVKKWLKENHEAAESLAGENYIIKTIPPQADIEYKMIIIQPDPEIDFTIRVINPHGPPSGEMTHKLAALLKEGTKDEK